MIAISWLSLSAPTEGLGYLYAFDDDFEPVEDVYRLDKATNPYDPD
jgi:hypothetical protein